MKSLATSVLISALANAASLAIAVAVFAHLSVSLLGYVIAVVLITFFSVTLRGIVTGTVNRFVRGYTIAGGLVLTAIALGLTNVIVPDVGFLLHGVGTWIGTILIIWAAGIAYGEVDKKAPETR